VSTIAPLETADGGTSDDSQLVQRARAGDVEARDRLIGRYLRDVYAVTFRILGEHDLAEDAAQDAFVNALGALPRFRGESSFRTWLLRVAVNSARSLSRRRVRRREVSIVAAEDLAGGEANPATRAVALSEVERVRHALEQLPEKQRLSVALRTQQGLSHAEIAELIGSTEGAVRVNYHLGIKRLRELLK
jgi:RNA polymerase sigma-70 factor (ECF subfamily)